ncbi:hypothetical protein [Acidocella sp. C78]|uniref:hypothetical protein n=1 Tax=Acidocella sp. C78 TaxID=1671486 RepID=UPI00191B93B3|nr:hypothetical protein [Acidocella sp. C78]
MKFSIVAAGLLLAAMAAQCAVARAQPAQVQLATRDMTQMLSAIGHSDYKSFVAPTTPTFRAHVGSKKFPAQAAAIDAKIPLSQPFAVKYLTTQRVGSTIGYIFEVTLQGGNQVLTDLTLNGTKVSSFHLL